MMPLDQEEQGDDWVYPKRPPATFPRQGREELADELKALRASGRVKRVVLANGCFDVLHVGHVRYLHDARSRGDFLIVALNEDATVRKLKGPGRPRVHLAERAELIEALGCVDRVVSFGETTLHETLRCLRPDVHAKGTDYSPEEVPERDVDLELKIEIAICGDSKRHSSSEMIAGTWAETPPAASPEVPPATSPAGETRPS